MKRVWMVLIVLVLLLGALTAYAEPAPVFAKTLKMNKAKVTITNLYQKPGTVQLKATTTPVQTQLTDPTITWVSDNEAIATVDNNGLVTGVGEGSVKIRASIQGKTKVLSVVCTVTVKAQRAKNFSLNCGDILTLDHTDASHKTFTLGGNFNPPTSTFQDITYTIADSNIASIDDKGVVTAKNAGETIITATSDLGKKTAKVKLTVRDRSGMVSITVGAGGDIVLGGDPLKKTDKRFEKIIQDNGYDYVLKNLRPIFAQDDFTILNLEGPLKGGKPKKPDRKYNFYGKAEYTNILTAGSVEVVNIANNHINDYGTKKTTRSILKKAGIIMSDTQYLASENQFTVKGVKVGFVGIQTPYSITKMRQLVKKAKADNDLMIMSFHFCEVPEHTHSVRSSQAIMARAAIDAGADMVIGHHSHVTSGIEMYKGKYIYYGIGAVESSGPRFKYNNFIMQQKVLVDVGTGYTESMIPTIYPIFSSSAEPTPTNKKPENNCQPKLLNPGEAGYDYIFNTIDKYSRGASRIPAPYVKGKP